MTDTRKEGIFAHWPNRITAGRFVASLALFTLLAVEGVTGEPRRGALQVSFWLFIAIATTDLLDGWLARRGGQETAFGRIADPFVDKVLVLGTMIFLAVMEWSRPWFPAWIIVVVLAREFLVTGIRGYVESLGREFPADWFGKVKMTIQCLAIGFVVGQAAFVWSADLRHFWGAVAHVLVWGTLVASIGSGITYVAKTKRLLDAARAG
ncbi:MAG: CDP-diacylglycerol--glycerol-3-phosphate 3-phosphatidyltransferase [Planctomycetota bacterium]